MLSYGVTDSLDNNTIKTKSESGLVLSYSRNTFTPRIWSVNIHMTKEEYETLIAWYRDVLGGGSGWFRYPDLSLLDGTMATYMFDEDPSASGTQQFKDVSCKFRECPV